MNYFSVDDNFFRPHPIFGNFRTNRRNEQSQRFDRKTKILEKRFRTCSRVFELGNGWGIKDQMLLLII